MSSASSTAWPSGVSPPLTTDNENNHSGLVVVITSFYLVLILASLAARVFSSYQRHAVQHNDYLFGTLVIAAIIQVSVVFTQVHYGWGIRMESITATEKAPMLKAGYAADILSILALGLSKIITSVFYDTLFSSMQRRFIRAVLVGNIIWTILSVLLLAIRCSRHPWNDISAQCHGLFPRWQAITAIDIVTELLLAFYSGLAVYKVKISTKKRILVFLALECRILLIPLAALRLRYTKAQLDSSYPTLLGSFATVTTEVYLSLSVVCLVTASLKSFIAVYEDKNGISYTEGASRSGSKSMMPSSKDAISHKILPYTSASVDRLRGWERMEDPILGPSGDSQGLQIMKTVQLTVRDESIELTERGNSTSL